MTDQPSHQSEHEHATQDQPAAAGEDQADVLSIIAQVENRLAHLRSASRESSEAIETIKQKQAHIEQRERELAAIEQEFHKRREQMEARSGELDAQQTALSEDKATIEARGAELNQQSEQCARREAEINRKQAALEAQAAQWHDRQAELDRQLGEITAQRQSIENDREQLDRDRAQLDEQCAARENELASARAAFEEHQRRAEAKHAGAINNLTNQLHESHEQVQALQSQLDAVRAELGEQCEEATRRAASVQTELESMRTKKNDQARQLDVARSKLVELAKAFEEQARQIETVGASTDALAQRDDRISQLQAQVESLNSELTAANEKIGSARSDASSSQADVDQRLAELNEEIARRDQAIEQISTHLKELKNELKEKSHALDATRAKLESRDDDLARLREQFESQGGSASGQSAPGDARKAGFLEHRRRRLEAMRRAIVDRSKRLNKARDVVRKQVHEVKASQEDRQTLIEVRENLERAEQRMIARWARSTTISQLFVLVLTLSILGMGSYFGVMTFWPTTYTAHATIQAKGRPGFPLTEQQVGLWQTVHEDMLMSDTVVESAASRLEQRGYTDLAQPEYLKAFLQEHMVNASPQPGTIALQMTATGRDEAQRILETYSIALVSTSNAERGRRTDGATTNLSDPAQTDPLPVRDDRVKIAGIVFGCAVGALFFAGIPIYVRLRRSPRIFDESNDLFEPLMDDARWKDIADGAHQSGTEHVIE